MICYIFTLEIMDFFNMNNPIIRNISQPFVKVIFERCHKIHALTKFAVLLYHRKHVAVTSCNRIHELKMTFNPIKLYYSLCTLLDNLIKLDHFFAAIVIIRLYQIHIDYLMVGLRYGFYPRVTDVVSRTSEVRASE